MADYSIHLSQAKHNEEVAERLVNEPPYHDWGITAAFYASIHYLESWIFGIPEKHSETSIPVDNEGSTIYSPHSWREKIVEQKTNREIFKAFRKLRDASETARYLSLYRIGDPQFKWITAPASDYFKPKQAKQLVIDDLQKLKLELKIELSEILHSLKLHELTSTAPLIHSKILSTFKTKEDFLNSSSKELKRLFTEDIANIILRRLGECGIKLTG